jgi:hypothetical protein
MLKAPVNIALAVPQLATKLAAAGAKAVGADKASEYLGSKNLMFDTDLGQEIEWLIITELLELPFQQADRVSQRDALAETILAAPELRERLQQSLEVIGRKGDDADFRERLEASMETYAGTRAAAAEIATSLMTSPGSHLGTECGRCFLPAGGQCRRPMVRSLPGGSIPGPDRGSDWGTSGDHIRRGSLRRDHHRPGSEESRPSSPPSQPIDRRSGEAVAPGA